MKRSIHQENNQPEGKDAQKQSENPHGDSTQSKLQKQNPEDEAKLGRVREQMRRDVLAYKEKILGSSIYHDDNYQYRHIKLPPEIAQYLPQSKDGKILLRENEYRQLGINISSGWEHYMVYQPEPNILLLRRSHKVAKEMEEERQRQEAEKQAKETAGPAKEGKTSRRRLPKSTRPTSAQDSQKPQAD